MKKPVLFTLFSLILLFIAAGPIQAGEIDFKLTEVMASADADTKIPVIIRLENQEDIGAGHASDVAASKLAELLQKNAAASQGLLKALLRAEGVQNILSLWIINGIALSLTVEQIWDIADHPNVKSIVLDDVVQAPIPPQPAATGTDGEPWDNLGVIGANVLWEEGIDGTGVVVASMDTGVDAKHQDLSASWRGGTNSWFDPHGEHSYPFDATGHGTQVMGVLVGGAKSGIPIGVAPAALWIAVKIFDDAGMALYSDIHAGFQWLLDPDGLPDTEDAPHVVNNSWSYEVGQCILEFNEDIEVLKSAGITVSFSAGNSSGSASPANNPASFAVGALDQNLDVASFSGLGPSVCDGALYPDLTAPGVGIYTADKTSGGVFPSAYTKVTGTSFAAPHAAGAMALLKDAFPGATVDEIEEALIQSALDLGDPGLDHAYGNGIVAVDHAFLKLTNPPGCLDVDNDGYFDSADCGTLVDCKDGNAGVSPAASEIKHDGIDQNCNGSDLTIDILSAVYLAGDDKLEVEATSSLVSQADLEVMGYGAMKWDRKKEKWTISVRNAGGDPGFVIVSGIEGAESALTTVDEADGGGTNPGGGKGKKK